MDVFDANRTCPIIIDLDSFDTEIANSNMESAKTETSIHHDVWTAFLDECDKIDGDDIILQSTEVIWQWGGNLDTKSDFYVHFVNYLRDICQHNKRKIMCFFARLYGLSYREISKKYGGGTSTYYDWTKQIIGQNESLGSVLKKNTKLKKYL